VALGLTGLLRAEIYASANEGSILMGDLPPAVVRYFRSRGLDISDLDDLPLTKEAFEHLENPDYAVDVLDSIGDALDKDIKHGHHVPKKEEDAAPTMDEKLQTYVYAIH
jgi:hypothetical protein